MAQHVSNQTFVNTSNFQVATGQSKSNLSKYINIVQTLKREDSPENQEMSMSLTSSLVRVPVSPSSHSVYSGVKVKCIAMAKTTQDLPIQVHYIFINLFICLARCFLCIFCFA